MSRTLISANTSGEEVVPEDGRLDSIGARIRYARKERSQNQEGLAALLGVSQPTVANWEADVHNPRQAMLAKIADALDVSLEWLALGDGRGRMSAGHPGIEYLQRPIIHVPVVDCQVLTAPETLVDRNLCSIALEYLPFNDRSGRLVATRLARADTNDTPFDADTIIVVDLDTTNTPPGTWALSASSDGPRVIACPSNPPPVDAQTGRPLRVIGAIVAAVKHF